MPQGPNESDGALVAIVETIDSAEVAVVKSLLESADIPFLARGEDQYDAFRGAFRGTVFSSRGRPVVILVPQRHAADARALLDRETPLSDE